MLNATRENQYRISKEKGYLASSGLLLIAFSSAFFPRIIESIGAPAPVNFIHFFIIPIACLYVLAVCRVTDKKHLSIVRSLIQWLYVFLGVMTASALLNRAGAVNIFLNYMIQAEPFLFLAAVVCIPFSRERLEFFRSWIIKFGIIHLLLAFIQWAGLKTGVISFTDLTLQDNIQGVFYVSSGGHVVGATVSLIFGLYYYVSAPKHLIKLRLSVLAAAFTHVLISDAKQVVMVGMVAWCLLILSRAKDLKVTIKYITLASGSIYSFYWAIYNIEFLRSYRTWIRPEIYGPNGDATLQKWLPIESITGHFTSIWHWFLGLGPGHTVGRIGGWMIRDYSSLLQPLGATTHPVVQPIWGYWRDSYLDSSFFSPFWGWAGIWGDGGFLGLGVYLCLWGIVWFKVCEDDLSRFLVLNVLVNGFIFTLMEEPGFMLTTAAFLGLRWQELNFQSSPQQQVPTRLIRSSL